MRVRGIIPSICLLTWGGCDNTPGANANAAAEEVVALMLADARHLILRYFVSGWKVEKKNLPAVKSRVKPWALLGLVRLVSWWQNG